MSGAQRDLRRSSGREPAYGRTLCAADADRDGPELGRGYANELTRHYR
jgi:hypothetical protein